MNISRTSSPSRPAFQLSRESITESAIPYRKQGHLQVTDRTNAVSDRKSGLLILKSRLARQYTWSVVNKIKDEAKWFGGFYSIHNRLRRK